MFSPIHTGPEIYIYSHKTFSKWGWKFYTVLVFLTKQRLINYSWSWLTATGTLEVQGEDLRRIVDLPVGKVSCSFFRCVTTSLRSVRSPKLAPSDKRQLVKRSRNHRGSSLPWMENYWNSSITFHSEVGFPSSTKRASTKEVDRVPKSTL